jgi:hypothetical protein
MLLRDRLQLTDTGYVQRQAFVKTEMNLWVLVK